MLAMDGREMSGRGRVKGRGKGRESEENINEKRNERKTGEQAMLSSKNVLLSQPTTNARQIRGNVIRKLISASQRNRGMSIRFSALSSPSLPPSFRMSQVYMEGAYDVLERATRLEQEEGRDIIHLELGQPSFRTPPHVVECAINALKDGNTKYTSPSGIAALKDSICRYYNQKQQFKDICIQRDEVVVGPGAKPGLFFAVMALVDPGDHVIIPDPGFPSYSNTVNACGGISRPVKLNSNRSGIDVEALKSELESSGGKTKVLLINSPSNPTGGVQCKEDLREIALLAHQHNFLVISDEIYSRLAYPKNDSKDNNSIINSIIEEEGMKERTVIIDGFSKTHAMTGWRLGWAICPKWLAEKIELLLVHSVGCTCSFTQAAGIAALDGPQDHVDEMVEEYKKRRNFVVRSLNSMRGVTCEQPDGAFYAFPDISSLGMSSKDMCNILLNEGGVAILPGCDFGVHGEGFIRISYVSSMDVLEEGLSRIERTICRIA